METKTSKEKRKTVLENPYALYDYKFLPILPTKPRPLRNGLFGVVVTEDHESQEFLAGDECLIDSCKNPSNGDTVCVLHPEIQDGFALQKYETPWPAELQILGVLIRMCRH